MDGSKVNLAPEGADGAPKVNAGALLSGCLEKADASAAVLSILGVKPPSGEEDEEVEVVLPEFGAEP